MPFLDAITGGETTQLQAQGFYAPQYLLMCPNTQVFVALINQTSFNTSFDQITLDTITTGAFGDIEEGFTAYISDTADPRDAPKEHIFRVRADDSGVVSTATTININQTSAALSNNQFIIVTKDVREAAKLPYKTASVYNKDSEITYQAPRPIIYNLQTAYIVQRAVGGGNADLALAPLAYAVASGSSISSWAWDIDGGSFAAGGAATQNITARQTVLGHYLYRVTVTDSNGNTNWFAFHVFIVPDDFSSEVIADFDGASIENVLESGLSASIIARGSVSTMLDSTLAVIYSPGNKTAINGDILFVGRFRNEDNQSNASAQFARVNQTAFQMEGAATIMSRLISRNIPMTDDASPDRWDEITNLTPWRAVAYYLAEHTTIPNTHSITFDDVANTFRFPSFTAADSNPLDTVQHIMATINTGLEYAPQGEIRIARQAVFQTTAERNALTTIADWTVNDISVPGNAGQLISLRRDYANTIGLTNAWGGYFVTGNNEVKILQARTPAVTQSDGNERTEINRQVLTTNSTSAAASSELGQRNADDMAAKQAVNILTVPHPPEYRFLIPSRSQWYTWTLAATDNDRGLTFDTNTRWLLQSVSIQQNNAAGTTSVNAVYAEETSGTGFQTVTMTPPTAQAWPLPVLPGLPAYPNLVTATPNINSPDGTGFPAGNEPAIDESDLAQTNSPQDPGVSQTQQQVSGWNALVWDASSAWLAEGLAAYQQPSYIDATPTNLLGTIKDCDLDPFPSNSDAWLVSNDGTDSAIYHTVAIGQLVFVRTSLADSTMTSIRPAGVIERLYAHGSGGSWTHTIDLTTDLEGGIVPASDAPQALPAPTGGSAGGSGVASTLLGGGEDGASVGWVFGIDVDFTALRFDGTLTNTRSGSGGKELRAVTYDGVGFTAYINADGSIGAFSKSVTTSFTLPAGDKIYFRTVQDTAATHYITSVQFSGTGTNPFASGVPGTRYSSTDGDSFAPLVSHAASVAEPGLDVFRYAVSTRLLVGANGKIQEQAGGLVFSDTTNGTTAGTYAKAINAYDGDDLEFYYGTAAAVAGETFWKVDAGGATARTPNDGADDGIVVGARAIAVSRYDSDIVWALCDFGGTVKLAYSTDAGVTWGFNTQVTGDAIAITSLNNNVIFIADGATVWYSNDGGVTLIAKSSPSSALLGVVVK